MRVNNRRLPSFVLNWKKCRNFLINHLQIRTYEGAEHGRTINPGGHTGGVKKAERHDVGTETGLHMGLLQTPDGSDSRSDSGDFDRSQYLSEYADQSSSECIFRQL